MKKESFTDPITLIPRVNFGLVISVFLLVVSNLILSYFLITKFILNPPPTYVYRLYNNPEKNEFFKLESPSAGVTKKDVETFLTYLIENLDFQSEGTIRYQNYSKILSLCEGKLKIDLIEKKEKLLSKKTNVRIVRNRFQSVDFYPYDEDTNVVLAKTKIKAVKVDVENTASVEEKVITFALKKVLRKYYSDSQNIGGKYYGLVLIGISENLDIL